MTIGPRTRAALIASLFLAPIVASLAVYRFGHPQASANYGELILPPRLAPAPLAQLRGRWVLVTSDSGACEEACRQKLYAMRQVRLALGRNASRVARVLVIDDDHALDAGTQAADTGLDVVRIATQARGDRAHIYLADPHGNVMLRWPSNPDLRRMYQDIDRLLKASQIG